jgi:hypothetical protein
VHPDILKIRTHADQLVTCINRRVYLDAPYSVHRVFSVAHQGDALQKMLFDSDYDSVCWVIWGAEYVGLGRSESRRRLPTSLRHHDLRMLIVVERIH